MTELSKDNWIVWPGVDQAELGREMSRRVEARVQEGKFSRGDCAYIKSLPARLIPGNLEVSDLQLERLRRMCQLAEVQLVPAKITSHRPFIGPIIVTAKKLLFSVVGVLLKDTLRKQRDFNAAVISYVASLSQAPKDK